MPNSIALAEKCLPLLDEVYKASAKTSNLDATRVDFVNANTVKVFKTSMDGLGDYSRNDGFLKGDVTGEWETMKLTKDRGRTFMVDSMDNEETIGLAFGTLAGEFIRTRVVPEIDAYTFAKIAGTSGVDAPEAGADITIGETDVPALIEEAERSMNENEVPVEGRILYISESAFAALRGKILRTTMNGDGAINTGIATYDGMQIIRVPQNRFYTAITLQDGKTGGQEKGGFKAAEGANKINFMIVHPSALCKVVKHALPRIFSPNENQVADAWKFDYRIYHDTFVYDNKVKGIYLHKSASTVGE